MADCREAMADGEVAEEAAEETRLAMAGSCRGVEVDAMAEGGVKLDG